MLSWGQRNTIEKAPTRRCEQLTGAFRSMGSDPCISSDDQTPKALPRPKRPSSCWAKLSSHYMGTRFREVCVIIQYGPLFEWSTASWTGTKHHIEPLLRALLRTGCTIQLRHAPMDKDEKVLVTTSTGQELGKGIMPPVGPLKGTGFRASPVNSMRTLVERVLKNLRQLHPHVKETKIAGDLKPHDKPEKAEVTSSLKAGGVVLHSMPGKKSKARPPCPSTAVVAAAASPSKQKPGKSKISLLRSKFESLAERSISHDPKPTRVVFHQKNHKKNPKNNCAPIASFSSRSSSPPPLSAAHKSPALPRARPVPQLPTSQPPPLPSKPTLHPLPRPVNQPPPLPSSGPPSRPPLPAHQPQRRAQPAPSNKFKKSQLPAAVIFHERTENKNTTSAKLQQVNKHGGHARKTNGLAALLNKFEGTQSDASRPPLPAHQPQRRAQPAPSSKSSKSQLPAAVIFHERTENKNTTSAKLQQGNKHGGHARKTNGLAALLNKFEGTQSDASVPTADRIAVPPASQSIAQRRIMFEATAQPPTQAPAIKRSSFGTLTIHNAKSTQEPTQVVSKLPSSTMHGVALPVVTPAQNTAQRRKRFEEAAALSLSRSPVSNPSRKVMSTSPTKVKQDAASLFQQRRLKLLDAAAADSRSRESKATTARSRILTHPNLKRPALPRGRRLGSVPSLTASLAAHSAQPLAEPSVAKPSARESVSLPHTPENKSTVEGTEQTRQHRALKRAQRFGVRLFPPQ